MTLNPATLFRFIPGGVPSSRYVTRFNAEAAALSSPIRIIHDPNSPTASVTDLLRISELVGDGTRLAPPLWSDDLVKEVRRVVDTIERKRLEKVEASFYFHQRFSFHPPMERLTQTERAAVEIFRDRVKPLIDRIEARQQHPDSQRLAALMVHGGDYYSKLLFQRFRRDTLAGPYAFDEEASLFPFFPDRPSINGMIDPSIPMDEVAHLAATLRPDAEEFRPTTVLRKEGDRIVAVPLPLHPPFREDHQKLAEVLETIAALNMDGPLDSSLQDQLRKWARFFRTGTAADEAAAAQATIDAGEGGGNLRVHIGPSESYWPDNMKFPYVLQVGIRDQELAARMAGRRDTFLALEASLTGIPHYQPRLLSTRGGFADPIYQAVTGGFVETYQGGEVAGNNFPNYPYAGAEGGNRFILLESLTFNAHLMKLALSRLVDEDVSGWDAVKYNIEMTVEHESGHLLGPPRGHITPSGQRMATVFDKHWGSADEPKSDLTLPATIRARRSAGEISEDEARDRLRALVALQFSARYRGKEAFFSTNGLIDHAFGIMMQVGWFFKKGVYTLRGDRIHIDYEGLQEAGHELWRQIISFQAAGDLEGFLTFAAEQVREIPEEADRMILEANKDLKRIFVERYLA